MNIVLMVAILAISTMAAYAQDQQPDTAKVKADAENMVNIIIGDKLKIQTYCEILDLDDQIDDANLNKDTKKATELSEQADESIIAAFGPPAALAAKKATTTIPVIFVTGGDPVAMGLVDALNQPGGNVTGVNLVNSELGSKRLEILAELVPSANLIAFLDNPRNPDSSIETGDALAAARNLERQGFIENASTDQEIETAFAAIAKRQAGALFVGVDPFFNARRSKIVSLAAQYKLPAIYQFREFTDAGGLVSYGASLADAYRQAAGYVSRILAGAQPSDLPVLQSAKFELVLNLGTAKALGLTAPQSLLAQADDVIQ